MTHGTPRRSDSSAAAPVDHLYGFEEQAPRPRRPWWVSAALTVLVSSALTYSVLFAINRLLPLALIVALCAAAVLVGQASRSSVEPPWRRVGQLVRPIRFRRQQEPDAGYEGGDGKIQEVRRWDRRLDWGTYADRFAHTVGVPLGELVDERLRQRHGITRASNPALARELVGARVWALLGPLERIPSHRQVMAALDDLDRL
jgi:hypothetical protein